MAGEIDTNEDAVDVAVLLLERRLNTELRFPGNGLSLCSGEGSSEKDDVSEH